MGKIAFGDSWKEPSWWTKPGKGQKLTRDVAQEVTEEDLAEAKKFLREAILGMVKNGIGIWNGPVVFYDEDDRYDKAMLDKVVTKAKFKNPKVPISRITRPK